MEIQALNGMRQVIERSPNLVLMVEWQYMYNKKRDTAKTLEVLDFMTERGYTFYKYIGGRGDSANCQIGKFVQMTVENLLAVTFDDIFFFPKTVPLPEN